MTRHLGRKAAKHAAFEDFAVILQIRWHRSADTCQQCCSWCLMLCLSLGRNTGTQNGCTIMNPRNLDHSIPGEAMRTNMFQNFKNVATAKSRTNWAKRGPPRFQMRGYRWFGEMIFLAILVEDPFIAPNSNGGVQLFRWTRCALVMPSDSYPVIPVLQTRNETQLPVVSLIGWSLCVSLGRRFQIHVSCYNVCVLLDVNWALAIPGPLALALSNFPARQYFATSLDGTKVPYFQLSKEGIACDGSNPTLQLCSRDSGVKSMDQKHWIGQLGP